ncbi:ADP-ribosyltransferase [Streptomyces sp. NPDC050315]|uniref:ADP-ribosyltransferase n=1 Tax=Streptomyces sp. NPDC050315 TaxID=3155039 RepID=UPI00341A1787
MKIELKPDQIPQYTGDLAQLEKDHAALKTDAGHIRTTGSDVHSHFQGLSAYYKAPEAEQLFATTKPVQDRADGFADGLETVASALSSYADEIRPLVPKLAELKTKAQNFIRDHKDDEDGDYDEDLIAEHNQIRDDITATVAAFWAAERTCHNKITALWGGTQMVAGDGSDKKNQYGFSAEDMKNAKLPWGDPVEEQHHWYEVGHWVKSFVWDGLIVDGIWGTIKGLGTLVGFGGWDAMGQAWKGLAQLATGLAISSIPGVGAAFWALPDDKLPSWLRDSRTAMKETGKALVAWDQWGKNPARAAGAVTFNVVTTVFTGGAGGAAAGAGKAGAVAKALSVAGKAGKVIDPMTYITKGAGAGLSKIGDITKSLKGIGNVDIPKLPDGSVQLPDGRLLEPNGNLVGTNGVVETTPIPHETIPGTSGLPKSWTIDQPAMSGAHAETGFPGPAHATDPAPMGGHSDTPVNPGGPASHAPSTPAGHTPGTPAGHFPGGPTNHFPGAPAGHVPGEVGTHVPGQAGPHLPEGPHTPGHDLPPTSHPHTPDAPHGPSHDGPGTHGHDGGHGGTHGHDGTHGGGHGDDAAGHGDDATGHGDDAAHAGDHGGHVDPHGLGDDALRGADDATAVGHHGTDAPGAGGAADEFTYEPHISADDFDDLPTAEKHKVAAAELSEGTLPFADDGAAKTYGKQYWNDYVDNLDPDAKRSLWNYSGESFPSYHDMNGYLRGIDGYGPAPEVLRDIDGVDRVLGSRPVPDNVMVVRGTGLGHLNLRSPLDMLGKTYPDKGYFSTSLGNHPVPSFAGKEAILHLRVPKGTPALWLEKVSQFGDSERELLLARGSEFKVTRVFMDNGQAHVYGEVLPAK